MSARKMRRHAVIVDKARDKAKPTRAEFILDLITLDDVRDAQSVVDRHRAELRNGPARITVFDGPGSSRRTVRIEVEA